MQPTPTDAQQTPAAQTDTAAAEAREVSLDNPDGTADNLDAVIPPHAPDAMPIVGLGGSAGAIPALRDFFSRMPANSDMAFIVVMHLSPDHESVLSEILGASTRMKVVQVRETMRVEANCVYVIPPDNHLQMRDGQIALAPIQQERGRRVAVDLLFRTLADSHGTSAVGVILSGADSDGSIGLKRIKERGGVTIAQDPEEAEHDSMPRTAIATGMVDWILPIAGMPERLLAYRENERRIRLPKEAIALSNRDEQRAAEKAETPAEAKSDETALRDILGLLRARTGHDFSSYKRASVLRRIGRRLQVNNLENIPAYLAFMRGNIGEAGALLSDLLIHVTNFFRDPDAFASLEAAIPDLFRDKTSDDQVRVWVAGCATGEEAYSVAILLSEYSQKLDDPPSILVFATDISDEAIAVAREGSYPETIQADVSVERLRLFFTHDKGCYRVRRELRERVLFASHNLLKDAPFSRLDLVTCRNLLIYLNREAQTRAFQTFHFALRGHARLFLGTSESADEAGDLFAPLDKKQRIYARQLVARAVVPSLDATPLSARPLASTRALDAPPLLPPPAALPPELPTSDAAASTRSERRSHDLSYGDLHLQLLERYAPPSILVNDNYEILHMSESAGRFLRFAGGEVSSSLLKVVHPALRLELSTALFTAAQRGEEVSLSAIPLDDEGATRSVSVLVRPVPDRSGEGRGLVLVLFGETIAESAAENAPASTRAANEPQPMARQLDAEVQHLKASLRTTIEQYEASVEELKASNEELQALNEEARSAAEELETGKEELQSVNEELVTVNQELKSSGEELRRTNSDLSNLMVSTDIGTLFLDRELRIKRYTPRAAQLFNLLPSDLERPISHLRHNLDYPELAQDAERVLAQLSPIEREVRAPDNRVFLTRVLPYRTVAGQIDGVVLTFHDISERKQIEETLHVSQEQTRLILESARDYAILSNDLERRVTSWNPGAQAIFRYAESEMLGQTIDILFTPEDREAGAPQEEAATALEKGRAEDERFHLRKGGARFYGSGVTMPLRGAGGNTIGFVKIMRDMTAQKQIEDALRESEARFRSVFDNNMVAMGVWSKDGAISDANDAFLQMVGGTREEMQAGALRWPDLTPPEYHAQDEISLAEIAARGASTPYEKEFVHRDGHRVPVVVGAGRFDESSERGIFFAIDVTERERAQQALRHSEERFRALISQGADMVTISDRDGKIIYASPTTERVSGYTVEEFAAQHPVELIHPDDRAHCRELLERLASTRGLIVNVQHRVRHKDGNWRWVEGTLSSLFHDPAIGGLVANMRDITDRKRAEDALRESEARLQSALSVETVGVLFFRPEGKITEANDAFLRMSGYSREDLATGLVRWDTQTAPEFTPQSLHAINEFLTEGRTEPYEKQYIRKDGARWWGLFAATRISDEEGVEFVIDISESKTAEQNLRSSEERFRTLVNQATAGVSEIDLDGRHIFVNQVFCDLLGYTPTEMTGMHLRDMTHPDDLPHCLETFQQAVASGESFLNEKRLFHRDGSILWVNDSVAGLRDAGGQVQSVVAITIDITERKAAEDALRRAHDELEARVLARTEELATTTEELATTNEELRMESIGRLQLEKAREQLLQRIVSTQEEERRRISRELHDQFGQQLTALLLGLKSLPDFSEVGTRPPSINARIETLQNIVDSLMQQMHKLAWELRPAGLDNFGLEPALRQYVAEWSEQSGIPAEFVSRDATKMPRLPAEVETALYRVVQEALTNVQRHAKAKNVGVLLERQDDHIGVIVEDDGHGFPVKQDASGALSASSKRLGILGMQERMDLVHGTLTIESSPGSGTPGSGTPGSGTTVYARVLAERRKTPREEKPAPESA